MDWGKKAILARLTNWRHLKRILRRHVSESGQLSVALSALGRLRLPCLIMNRVWRRANMVDGFGGKTIREGRDAMVGERQQ